MRSQKNTKSWQIKSELRYVCNAVRVTFVRNAPPFIYVCFELVQNAEADF